jgi:tetratricopeptide (TPR) repeat protein
MPKTAHELTRKELKGPDRFQVAMSGVADWVSKRQKAIALAAGAAAVIAVVAVGVSRYLEGERAVAGSDLYQAIEAASGEISDTSSPGAERPTYKTAAEKGRAVLEAAQKVRGGHSGARASLTAALLEGDALLDLGEWDKAIAAYRGYLSSTPADDPLRFAALFGVARGEEGKGDLAAAAKAYQDAAGIEAFKDRAALERARVLAKAGKKDEARKALEEIGKTSPLQPEASEQLARLGAS